MPGRNVLLWILATLLVASSLLPRSAQAAQAEVNGIFLFIDDYTNDSIVDAWAALNFTDVPIPPPNQVDEVLFEWYAPNGTLAFNEIVDPNDAAWAPSSLRVGAIGIWTVNVTYTTNTSVHESLDFEVVSNIWNQALVTLNHTTVVGRLGELTILPGTQVQMPDGAALRIQGKLTAVGTSGMPIIFTSRASVPSAGDWNIISFLETADNSSRISNARVRYSSGGIRVMGVSPWLDNITFEYNEITNLRLAYSSSFVRDLTINGAVYGFSVIGSAADIARVNVVGSVYGVLFQGMGGRISQFTATGCTQIGVYAYNASVSVTNSQLIDDDTGIQADNSTVFAEGMSMIRGRFGVKASDGSRVNLVNSTMSDVWLTHYSASGSSQIVALNVQLNPTTPMSRDLQDDSTLVIQNYLHALVRSYDTGAVLSGAFVEVRINGSIIASIATDSNGLVGPIAVTHGTYNHTAFFPELITVAARLSGYLFEDNNRIVNMATGHTETFNGSIYDNDHDGIPDFADSDDDNDGLSDEIEQGIGTDPKRADTDDDGMPDGYEVEEHFNPLDPSDGPGDRDGDGLTNSEEYGLGTDPQNPDSDNDGMPDGWEVGYDFDPKDSSDASLDADADGYTNLEEYRSGTNPRSIESKPPPNGDMGFLGAGDYWPLLLLPLAGLLGTVIFVSLAILTATPSRRRREVPASDTKTVEESSGDD